MSQFLAPILENFLDSLNAENWCTAWLSVMMPKLSGRLCSCFSAAEVDLRRSSNREAPELEPPSELAPDAAGFVCELLNFAFLGWLGFVWSCCIVE